MGAWIETLTYAKNVKSKDVASYMGAWIETNQGQYKDWQHQSHPTWVRGLKLYRKVEWTSS